MRFYFNADYNKCMDESSLIDFLLDTSDISDPILIRDELRYNREFCGWYECEVADAIKEKFFA